MPIQSAVRPGVRRIFIANLVVQAGIVVTGAIVRVTESGLGCPTWPECTDGSLVPTSEQMESWHKYVEFGNRLLTFVLALLAIAAIIAMLWQRRQWKRQGAATRTVLLVLAAVPLIGTVVQAILGGVTVLTGLHPATVSAHFLVSMLIIAACVALVARAGDIGDQPTEFHVVKPIRVLGWALVAAAAVVVFLGVMVTGTGPHSGDSGVDARFSFDFRTIAWLHADAVFLFVGLLIGFLIALHVQRSAPLALRRAWVLVGVTAVQAIVGYVQFFTGLPELLVISHVLGAVLVWVAVLFIPPSLRTRGNLIPRMDPAQPQGREVPSR